MVDTGVAGARPGGGEEMSEEKQRDLVIEQIREKMRSDVNTVLVVDDELPVRLLVTSVIEAANPTIQVRQALDGQDALEQLAEIRASGKVDPLFIVTDLQMPNLDGWGLIEALRKDYLSRGRRHGIPVIVLSASSGVKGPVFVRKSIEAGKCKYTPLAAVAKENCMDPSRYDAVGQKGLAAWVEYFLRCE